MYLTKKQRIEKINSISNCFNDLLGDLQKKKSLTSQTKQKSSIISAVKIQRQTRHDSPSSDKTRSKFDGLSLDKIIHQQNFEKKYTQIMSALSLSPTRKTQAAVLDSPEQKNILLWGLKIKKDGSIGKDQSLKRLEDLKLRLVYKQELEIPEEQKLYKSFLNVNTATFKQSNSSDFFKSTNNSESRTLYSSKNSFYNSGANNNNNFNVISNYNSNSNEQLNKLENLSFYSYKSFSSSKQGKQSNRNNINSSDLLSNFQLNSFGNYNHKEKTRQRVNFDDFHTIGENPYKINIYETHNQINSARKKVNLKNSDLNISPKNIYSPNKDGLSYYPNKRVFDINHLLENTNSNNNISNKKNNLDLDLNSNNNFIKNNNNNFNNNNPKKILDLNLNSIADLPSGKSRINLSPKGSLGPKENLSNLLKGSVNDRNRISSGVQTNRQYTLNKIDSLLKNFSNKTGSFLNNKKLVL